MRISPFLNSTKGYGALAFQNRDSIEIMPLVYFGSGYPSSFYPPLSEKKIVKGFFAFREGEGVRIYGTLVNWLIGLLVNYFVG